MFARTKIKLLEFWVGPTQPYKSVCKVRIALIINIFSGYLSINVRLLTHLSCPTLLGLVRGYNGGWPDSENLIAGSLMDLGGGSDTLLEFWIESNSTLQNQLVRLGLS
jgi:hypothetical protein